MDAADKPTSAAGRKALNDPRIRRYYVRLTSEQNERFLRMYEQSGMKNKADFICHRIFGGPFTVVVRDKNTYDFYVRLTGFYAQFRAIGANYNQCVKAMHMTFGDKKALAYLYRLTLETQRLEQLVKAVVELTKELLQWCRK